MFRDSIRDSRSLWRTERWTCQPDDYKHTATVTLGCPPVYEPTSTPTYEPPYTPAGAKCGRPKDKPCSEGYVCAKNKRKSPIELQVAHIIL